jgi:hypothetical protein
VTSSSVAAEQRQAIDSSLALPLLHRLVLLDPAALLRPAGAQNRARCGGRAAPAAEGLPRSRQGGAPSSSLLSHLQPRRELPHLGGARRYRRMARWVLLARPDGCSSFDGEMEDEPNKFHRTRSASRAVALGVSRDARDPSSLGHARRIQASKDAREATTGA